ncbi:MAG: hypothetical protein HHJ12_18575 [Glaciimonas sp.]|nr:hypothetical protein [Glaciimonas sp.]
MDRPLPSHVPQIMVCSKCNSGFSKDEEYFAIFLSCILAGTTDPAKQKNLNFQRALARNRSLLKRIENSKEIYLPKGEDESKTIWHPENDRINRVVLKNARGHAYFEFGEPIPDEPDYVWARPLETLSESERNDFEATSIAGFSAWPEVGSRMMTRVVGGQDLIDGWVVVQDNVYRYFAVQAGTMLVRTVIWGYLATEVYWG